MKTTAVAAFDKTIAKTNVWLDEYRARMAWDDRERAYLALRAVLHALRDRLMPTEAVDLGAQLPMLVRGFYYEGWHPAGKPLKYRDKEHFLEHIGKQAPWLRADERELAVTAAFEILTSHIGGGEAAQARALLPAELRELWAKPGM